MSASNFRELNDAQLAKLPDEELVAYIVRARAAGRVDSAVLGAQVLAFKHERAVTGWFQNQIGSKGGAVVDELAAVTIRDAVRWATSFEGTSVGEFRSGVFRIARRRRVDYLRKNRVDTVPFAFEGSDDAEEREFGQNDPLEAIDRMGVFNQAFSELNKDSHKLAILLSLHGYPYKEIARKVTSQLADPGDDPMSENNVSQIISRFNKRMDELLSDD